MEKVSQSRSLLPRAWLWTVPLSRFELQAFRQGFAEHLALFF
jgi:hypothetical protein